MTGQLDHPALEQAIQAQDQDSIRRLFLYERDLRIRAEITLDGMQSMKVKSMTELQAQQPIPQSKPKPGANSSKQTSLSLEELGL